MTTQSPPPTINPIDDDVLTDAQAARLLGVSPLSIWRYRVKGKAGVKLPSVSWGRKRVTNRAAIDWWFAELQRAEQQPVAPRSRRQQLDPATEAACEAAGI